MGTRAESDVDGGVLRILMLWKSRFRLVRPAMRMCSARFESLIADFSGRDWRVEVGTGSMISFSAGRLREVVVDEVVDNVDDCEVKEGVVEVV